MNADAYDRLHPEIRRWVRAQNWTALRDIQARATLAILDGESDLVIASTTASGKTEAAFLPILSKVADRPGRALRVAYVSPLKALINDQHSRLESLCERLEMPLVRWHGDAPQAAKTHLRSRPDGLVLITPESIEALLVRRPGDAARLFRDLEFIVIDELHAFMAGPRGLHLASLLKRLDALAAGRRARRIGLSATIGDLSAAAAWLRPDAPQTVTILEGVTGTSELRLQVRGYVDRASEQAVDEAEVDGGPGAEPKALDLIADHLFATLRGSNNLVFAASRRTVEAMADRLLRRSDRADVPNEFLPHHGSLSKELRETLERRLKDGALPTTAICTSTLELGIDIGSVTSVAQVGAPRSIASLRQRLGRTGRRPGIPSTLRVYVRELAQGADCTLLDLLRPNVVRAVAAIRLLTRRFVEPPSTSDALATALLHQTLSIIAERGGARPEAIFRLLGGPGPFASVTTADFIEVLRSSAIEDRKLIEQAPDGTLMLAAAGEELVGDRTFYALFASDPEWRLVHGGRHLGTIPISNAIAKGNLVVFGGRRWLVDDVDQKAMTLQVSPHSGGRIPKFERLRAEEAHDTLVAEMREVYETDDEPPWLDERGRALLAEGRAAYRLNDLAIRRGLIEDGDVHLFLWTGTALTSILAVALAAAGLNAEVHDLGLTVTGTDMPTLSAVLRAIGAFSDGDLAALPAFVENIRSAKFDEYLPDGVLRRFWAQRSSGHVAGIPALARDLAAALGSPQTPRTD